MGEGARNQQSNEWPNEFPEMFTLHPKVDITIVSKENRFPRHFCISVDMKRATEGRNASCCPCLGTWNLASWNHNQEKPGEQENNALDEIVAIEGCWE